MSRPTAALIVPATLIGTAMAGTLDIVAAILLNLRYGHLIVPQSVASGWMGRDAYAGGWTTALLGLAAHFVLMAVIAGLYMILAAGRPFLRTMWVRAGMAWGFIVWAVMTLIVVPLSASPLPLPDLRQALPQIVVHILAVGLPLAWIARRQFDTASAHLDIHQT